MLIDPDDPLREEKKNAIRKVALFFFVVLALIVLAVYAASAHSQKNKDGIFVCDTYYKFHMVMEVHLKKGYVLGVSAFNAYSNLVNKNGNPSCGYIADSKSIVWIEKLETFRNLRFPSKRVIETVDVELWLAMVVWKDDSENLIVTRKIVPSGTSI